MNPVLDEFVKKKVEHYFDLRERLWGMGEPSKQSDDPDRMWELSMIEKGIANRMQEVVLEIGHRVIAMLR